MALKTYNIDLYEKGQKEWKDLTPAGRIFHALLHGGKLSPSVANDIGGTTEGTRYIRYIRKDGHPIETTSHKSQNGGVYYKYSFSEEHIREIKNQINNS